MRRIPDTLILAAWTVLATLAGGCADTPVPELSTLSEEALPAPSYAWVWLHAGGTEETIGEAEAQAAQAGHFANMARLAEQGELLVAGPLWPPRGVATHRGVFVFRRGSIERAQDLAATDPAVQAGLLRMEVVPYATEADFAATVRRHADWVAASGIADPQPGLHCHGYVLLQGYPAGAARRALHTSDLPVLFHGTLGAGAELSELACLDLREVAELPPVLPGGDGVRWTVMPWFASEELGAF